MSSYHIEHLDESLANSSHTLVLGLVGRDKSVLDVGCSTGYLGEALARRGCAVTGLEMDAEAAEAARHRLDEVIEADLEAVTLAELLPGRQFDVVVFADVLEHLRDPAAVLRSAIPLLAPGGSVVVSVPNVGHGSIRLALLQGRWQYTETGLLDRTHIRFFTRDSFSDLFDEAGLSMTDLRSTVVDPLASEVKVDGNALPGAVVDWVRRQPDSMHYQFVARAEVSAARRATPDLVPAVELPRVIDEHTERAEREATLAQLPPEAEQMVAQLMDLRRRLLMARDHAIGADAAVGLARAELEVARADAGGLRIELEALRAEHASAVRELDQLKRSRTWRAGRLLVAPASRLLRAVRA